MRYCGVLKLSVKRPAGLPPETQARFPRLAFRGMRGMRNIIAHDYGDVDIELVWTTANTDLDELIETLSAFFR